MLIDAGRSIMPVLRAVLRAGEPGLYNTRSVSWLWMCYEQLPQDPADSPSLLRLTVLWTVSKKQMPFLSVVFIYLFIWSEYFITATRQGTKMKDEGLLAGARVMLAALSPKGLSSITGALCPTFRSCHKDISMPQQWFADSTVSGNSSVSLHELPPCIPSEWSSQGKQLHHTPQKTFGRGHHLITSSRKWDKWRNPQFFLTQCQPAVPRNDIAHQ